MPKKVGSKLYIVLSVVLGVWFFANYICFNILGHFLWIEDIALITEASNYATSALTYIDFRLIFMSLIYIVEIIFTCKFSKNITVKRREAKIIPVIICIL